MLQVQLVLKVKKVKLVHKVQSELKVILVHRVLQGLKVRKAL